MKKRIYFAYGSNLNHAQMARRCPDAEFMGTGYIEDYTLVFKGMHKGVADIIPCPKSRVPVGVWRISCADERSLDIYEGYPTLYGKRKIYADFGGDKLCGMVYIMARDYPLKMPFEDYFNKILDGYLDCGIDTEYFFEFVKNTADNVSL